MSLQAGHLLPQLARVDREAHPLDYYRCSGWPAEWVARNFGACRSIYNHAANSAGKTMLSMSLCAAMARGRMALLAFDGTPIPIPTPRPPVRLGIGTPSYKIGEGSCLDYLRNFLGTQDVREGRGSAGTHTFHVKHRLSRNERQWSRIYVLPYEGEIPEEIRLDAWFADGPPPITWLRGIANRARAGRQFNGLITTTPANAAEWEPLVEHYPLKTQWIDANGRASIQSSVYDNRFMHEPGCPGYDEGIGYCSCVCPAIVRQEQENSGFADARARLFGEHVNTVGGCPYNAELLDRWEAACVPPASVKEILVLGERDTKTSSGLAAVPLVFLLQVWEPDRDDDEYIVLLDPARGQKDGRHDPDGLHVRSRRTRALVARGNQYLGPWGLAAAGIEVARAYRDASVYVARGGGYGEAVLSALRVLDYHNLGRDRSAISTGRTSVLGINETEQTRNKAMEAVAAMLQRGTDRIPSADVIRCFRHCIVDENGKIVAGRKWHDEDLVLTGHGNRLLDMLGPLPEPTQPVNTALAAFEQAVRIDSGFSARPKGTGGRPTDIGRW